MVVRPLSRDIEKALDYRQWVEERRAYVAPRQRRPHRLRAHV
ncbi:MAG: hypothetical protein WKG07_26285 [Hymenobacter sp.]